MLTPKQYKRVEKYKEFFEVMNSSTVEQAVENIENKMSSGKKFYKALDEYIHDCFEHLRMLREEFSESMICLK
jgi:alpha-D-ribose 1-methylphosphonate 5-triphosphate diphosphatase PhnM